jgi:hypothetical protein
MAGLCIKNTAVNGKTLIRGFYRVAPGLVLTIETVCSIGGCFLGVFANFALRQPIARRECAAPVLDAGGVFLLKARRPNGARGGAGVAVEPKRARKVGAAGMRP